MDKVYDLAKYKKRKKMLWIKNSLFDSRFTIAFSLLFSLDITIWWLVSFKAAMFYTVLILFLPFIIKDKKEKRQIQSTPFRRPQ